jgi:hypothetical protein
MKYLAKVGVVIFVLSNVLQARQPSDVHQQTTPPSGARFEILQSELAAKWTFRLDRYTGRVAQLVRTQEDDNTWEEMRVIGLPTVTSPSRARFQLFASGLAARYMFLIDTDTGKTWLSSPAQGSVLTGASMKSTPGSPLLNDAARRARLANKRLHVGVAVAREGAPAIRRPRNLLGAE